MSSAAEGDRLHWVERSFIILLLIGSMVLGFLTYVRNVEQERRKGDLTVYLRAAWAVQSGRRLYNITDHNGWHYHYPPLLAILMVPLAEPPPPRVNHQTAKSPVPPQANRQTAKPPVPQGAIPFQATVLIWYAINLAALVMSVHLLATAFEASQPSSRRWWWLLRALPILACIVPIGHTLIRGQVNLLVLALICGMAAALVRGRSGLAGLSLAGAICIKIIPAFLLLYPIWKRDFRCLAGCAAGLAIGLGAIPLAVFGPQRTIDYYVMLKERVLEPGLGQGTDQSRAEELTNVTTTQSQSIQAVTHRLLHLDSEAPPAQADDLARLVHWGVGGLMIVALLAASGTGRNDSPGRCVLTIGLLTTLMVAISPVAHLHYFSLNIVLVVGILAMIRERNGWLAGWVEVSLGVGYPLALAVPHLPERYYLRELGLTLLATLVVAGAGLALLWRRDRPPIAKPEATPVLESLAA